MGSIDNFVDDVDVIVLDKDEMEELMLVDNEEIDIPSDDEDQVEEQLLAQQEHPLAVSIVASNILSYLSCEELCNSRLVCRAWEEEARVHLSNKVKVVLHSDERLQNYIYEFIGDRGFFDTVQLGPYMYMGNPLADRFFQIYGLYIKHLILQKTQCSAIHLREILFRWCPNVEELTLFGMTPGKTRFLEDLHIYDRPNLHNLKILNINLMLTQGEDLLRDFLYDLFSVSPNIQKITVPRNTYKGFLTCLISTLLESPDLPLDNLSHVDALFSFGDGQIEQLTSRRFPIESLNMQLMPNVTLELLLPLLESLNGTLKNLRLYFYLTRFKEIPTLVRMDKVEKLTLDTYNGSLRFISQLPELKDLSVTMKCLNELENAFPRTHTGPGFWSCRSLRSFSASLSVVEGCPSGFLGNFESVFPGLRSINLQGLTDIALRLLCSTYPKLEELSAPQGTYTDMGITGLAEGKLRFLARSVSLNDPDGIKKYCETQYLGNIGNLSKLRKLRLQSPELTDDSIFFGILHLKELKELSIERSDITDKGIDAITNYMDIHRLSITLCTRVSGPQLELVKAKMKNRNLVLNFDGKRYSMYD